MQVESVERVIERMDQAMTGVLRPVLTTDADGTLWNGDVGEDAFVSLIEERAVRDVCRSALAAEAEAAGLDPGGDSNDLARRLYDAWRHGAYDESRCYGMMAWVFAGFTPDEVRSFSTRVQEKTNLAARLHPEMQAIVKWAQKRSVELWVVSASPRFVVQTGAARFGIAPERVVATAPIIRDGHLVPDLAEPMPYGLGKVAAIERCIGAQRLIAAFGDNVFDLAMLAMADVPVAVRPTQRLRDRAAEEPRLVELGCSAG